jgi:hypothetical protein
MNSCIADRSPPESSRRGRLVGAGIPVQVAKNGHRRRLVRVRNPNYCSVGGVSLAELAAGVWGALGASAAGTR